MKKSYNAPRTESLELMGQMIMAGSPGGEYTPGTNTSTIDEDHTINFGN